MCSTSRRVPWKALLAVAVASTSQIGVIARSRAAAALSTTIAAAPIPSSIPCRRRSNGSAASSTTSSVAAAPEARKPDPTHGSSCSEVTSSAAITITRRARPARIQSSRQGDRLRGARAGRVDLGVRAARADQLGELRVTHRQHPEQEAAVELVRARPRARARARGCGARPRPARRRPPLASLSRACATARACRAARAGSDRLEAVELVGEVVDAREGGREDDPRVVAQRVRQHPAVGELRSRSCVVR